MVVVGQLWWVFAGEAFFIRTYGRNAYVRAYALCVGFVHDTFLPFYRWQIQSLQQLKCVTLFFSVESLQHHHPPPPTKGGRDAGVGDHGHAGHLRKGGGRQRVHHHCHRRPTVGSHCQTHRANPVRSPFLRSFYFVDVIWS